MSYQSAPIPLLRRLFPLSSRSRRPPRGRVISVIILRHLDDSSRAPVPRTTSYLNRPEFASTSDGALALWGFLIVHRRESCIRSPIITRPASQSTFARWKYSFFPCLFFFYSPEGNRLCKETLLRGTVLIGIHANTLTSYACVSFASSFLFLSLRQFISLEVGIVRIRRVHLSPCKGSSENARSSWFG